jgi:putative cardiolipin synthase
VVHSGYANRRQELLRAGVQLYEFKPTAGKESPESKARFGASSSSGLHAKAFAVDRSRLFVGSFNFDQRSALLNTEMGLVIDSSVLAQRLATIFDSEVPMLAYEVRLTPDGNLEWIERTASGEKRYDTDPDTSWFLRWKVDMMSILPIEWLL